MSTKVIDNASIEYWVGEITASIIRANEEIQSPAADRDHELDAFTEIVELARKHLQQEAK